MNLTKKWCFVYNSDWEGVVTKGVIFLDKLGLGSGAHQSLNRPTQVFKNHALKKFSY